MCQQTHPNGQVSGLKFVKVSVCFEDRENVKVEQIVTQTMYHGMSWIDSALSREGLTV
jgi:hypothetical protein